jgi:hypothetical protein
MVDAVMILVSASALAAVLIAAALLLKPPRPR